MTIRGTEEVVSGSVLFVLADTLAAHELGGFKVGVGFALRKCRQCLATGEQMSTQVAMIIALWMYLICMFHIHSLRKASLRSELPSLTIIAVLCLRGLCLLNFLLHME